MTVSKTVHLGSNPSAPAKRKRYYMHQHYKKGKKLLLIFKDGHQELGKYRVAEKGILYFQDRDPVPLKKLRAATYYKEGISYGIK